MRMSVAFLRRSRRNSVRDDAKRSTPPHDHDQGTWDRLETCSSTLDGVGTLEAGASPLGQSLNGTECI